METGKYHCPDNVIIGEGHRIDNRAIVGHEPLREDINTSTRIGDNLTVLAGAIIYKGITLGSNAVIGHNAVIREESRIGENFRIWNNSIVDYDCRIGDNVKIHSNCYIAQYTIIEDNVFLAPGVTIGNDLHPGCDLSLECMKKTSVVIRKGAQIGLNVTILPNVVIGERAMIGAGAVVTGDVPAEAVVTGNPARGAKSIYELKCVTGLTDKPYHEGKK